MFLARGAIRRVATNALQVQRGSSHGMFTSTRVLQTNSSNTLGLTNPAVSYKYATRPGFLRNMVRFYLSPSKWREDVRAWRYGFGAMVLVLGLLMYRSWDRSKVKDSPVVAAGLRLVRGAAFCSDLIPSEGGDLEVTGWWGCVPSCTERGRLHDFGSRTAFVEVSCKGVYCFTLELTAESQAHSHYNSEGSFYPFGLPEGMVSQAKAHSSSTVPCVHITRAVVTSPRGSFAIHFGGAVRDARAHAQALPGMLPESLRYLSANQGVIEVPVVSQPELADLRYQKKETPFQRTVRTFMQKLGQPGFSEIQITPTATHALDVMPYSQGIGDNAVAVESLSSFPLLSTAQACEAPLYLSDAGYYIAVRVANTVTLQSLYADYMASIKEPATLFYKDELIEFFESPAAKHCPFVRRDDDGNVSIWHHRRASPDSEGIRFVGLSGKPCDVRFGSGSMPLAQWYALTEGATAVTEPPVAGFAYGMVLKRLAGALRVGMSIGIPSLVINENTVLQDGKPVGTTTGTESELLRQPPVEVNSNNNQPFTVLPTVGDPVPWIQSKGVAAVLVSGILASCFAAATHFPLRSLYKVCAVNPQVAQFTAGAQPIPPTIHVLRQREGFADVSLRYDNGAEVRLQQHRDWKLRRWNIAQSQQLVHSQLLPVSIPLKHVQFFTSEAIEVIKEEEKVDNKQ